MQDAERMLDFIKQSGGFTYQPVVNRSPKKGLALSIYPDRGLAVSKEKLTKETLLEYMEKNGDLLERKENHMGGWFNGDDGMVYIDISVIVHSPKKAEALCRQHQQKAYWDLGESKEVVVDMSYAGAAEVIKEHKKLVRFELPVDPTDEELEELVNWLKSQ